MFAFQENSTTLYLLHLWIGLVFVVIFPIYSWDHIKKNLDRLKKINLLSISGIIQLIAGLVLIISGLPLLLYGTDVFELASITHLIFTFVLAICLIFHKISRK